MVYDYEPNKCSGYIDGKCKHGHPIVANFVCRGSVLLDLQEEGKQKLLKQSLLMPSCVREC